MTGMQRELRNRTPWDSETELRQRLADSMAENPDLLVTHTVGSPYEISVTDRDGLPEPIQEYDLEMFLDRAKAPRRGGL